MMGLQTWIHWLGWGLTSLSTISISAFLMTLLLCKGRIFEFSNPLLIFIFLELFAISSVALSFAISVFFSKVRRTFYFILSLCQCISCKRATALSVLPFSPSLS